MTKANEIIAYMRDVAEAENFHKDEILDALSDGNYLENFGWSEEAVTYAYNYIEENWK